MKLRERWVLLKLRLRWWWTHQPPEHAPYAFPVNPAQDESWRGAKPKQQIPTEWQDHVRSHWGGSPPGKGRYIFTDDGRMEVVREDEATMTLVALKERSEVVSPLLDEAWVAFREGGPPALAELGWELSSPYSYQVSYGDSWPQEDEVTLHISLTVTRKPSEAS